MVVTRLLVGRGEEPAETRFGAEHREERGGSESGIDVARMAAGSLIEAAAHKCSKRREDGGLPLPFLEGTARDEHARAQRRLPASGAGPRLPDRGTRGSPRGEGVEVADKDKPAGVRVRERVQHYGIEHAEDGGVGSDAEGEDRDAEKRIAGGSAECV